MSAAASSRVPRAGGDPASERSSLDWICASETSEAAARPDRTPALILSQSKDAGDAGSVGRSAA